MKSDKIAVQSLTLARFKEEFSEYILTFTKEITGRVIPSKVNEAIVRYIYEYYRRENCSTGFETGIVFLGFGRKEKYPVVEELIYDGRYDAHFRIWPYRRINLNEDRSKKGVIVAFAQKDMTSLFMEGISSNYVMFFMRIIDGILNEKTEYLVKNFISDESEKIVEKALQDKENHKISERIGRAFKTMQQMEVINPLMEAIRALPREEMTAMAEAFVELTSMRRKVDSSLQTVGGPVDVAFISKGDGFVWSKRKLYFQGDMNSDFFVRREHRLKR